MLELLEWPGKRDGEPADAGSEPALAAPADGDPLTALAELDGRLAAAGGADPKARAEEIGRASCRERVLTGV